MGGPEIERLIALLAKLPGMGPRSARRAALKLLQAPEAKMAPLARALDEAARAVLACTVCGSRNYRTTRVVKNGATALRLKKFCRTCKQHTIHQETK